MGHKCPPTLVLTVLWMAQKCFLRGGNLSEGGWDRVKEKARAKVSPARRRQPLRLGRHGMRPDFLSWAVAQPFGLFATGRRETTGVSPQHTSGSGFLMCITL